MKDLKEMAQYFAEMLQGKLPNNIEVAVILHEVSENEQSFISEIAIGTDIEELQVKTILKELADSAPGQGDLIAN